MEKMTADPSGLGFHNLPFLVHRKSVKKGFEFTLMVVGESGLGKSTLVNTLFLHDLYEERNYPSAKDRIMQTVNIDTFTVDIEERGVKLRLTVVDTPGFGDAVDNRQCWKPIIDYINEQYNAYLRDESGLNRRNIEDHRVHCCLYFISPTGHGLKPLDIEFMKQLHELVNIVPVIAKADTLTPTEVQILKRRVLKDLHENRIQIYTGEMDEEDDSPEMKQLKEAIPLAVVGSNTMLEVNGKRVRGRIYPWGVVEVENKDHCDFVLLRDMIVRTHMQDLKDITQDVHYENFRKKKLLQGGGGAEDTDSGMPIAGGGGGVMQEEMRRKEKELDEIKRQMAFLQAQLQRQQGMGQSDTV